MAQRWIFNGFDVTLTYTIPVPPGQTADKLRVTIGNNVTKEEVPALLVSIHQMMRDIAAAFAEADPYQGWAPFVYGTSVQPDWLVVDVP